MPITVNGVELADTDIERERNASDSPQAALTAAILRRVLLDEAAKLAIPAGPNDEATIESLLKRETEPPGMPTQDECRRHYAADQERWRVGQTARVSHILFQVTERVDLAALKTRAQQTLDELLAASADLELRFVDRARTLSNCPSGIDGGALGDLGRGDTVPEFEHAVFATPANTLCPTLVETRFGLHIVRVHEKTPGKVLPFEQAEARIRNAMSLALRDKAERQYVADAIGRAQITGWKDGSAQ
jgi:peptidyl-prolyl cis-trans isomerase C